MTKAVNIKFEEFDVYCGRPSMYGNPYFIGKDCTRAEAILKYKIKVLHDPFLLKEIHKLKGKRLGCFCKPLACHCDILVEIAEGNIQGACGSCDGYGYCLNDVYNICECCGGSGYDGL